MATLSKLKFLSIDDQRGDGFTIDGEVRGGYLRGLGSGLRLAMLGARKGYRKQIEGLGLGPGLGLGLGRCIMATSKERLLPSSSED